MSSKLVSLNDHTCQHESHLKENNFILKCDLNIKPVLSYIIHYNNKNKLRV